MTLVQRLTEQYLIIARTNTNKLSPQIRKHKFPRERIRLGYLGIYVHCCFHHQCFQGSHRCIRGQPASSSESGSEDASQRSWKGILQHHQIYCVVIHVCMPGLLCNFQQIIKTFHPTIVKLPKCSL